MVGSSRGQRQRERATNYRENIGQRMPKRSVDSRGRPHKSKAKREGRAPSWDPFLW